MTSCWISAPLCVLLTLTIPASATFQVPSCQNWAPRSLARQRSFCSSSALGALKLPTYALDDSLPEIITTPSPPSISQVDVVVAKASAIAHAPPPPPPVVVQSAHVAKKALLGNNLPDIHSLASSAAASASDKLDKTATAKAATKELAANLVHHPITQHATASITETKAAMAGKSSESLLAMRDAMQETTNRIPNFDSAMMKSGATSIGFDGIVDGVKIGVPANMMVSMPTEKFQNAMHSLSDNMPVVDTEKVSLARQNMLDGINEQLSSAAIQHPGHSVMDFSKWYVTTLNDHYQLQDVHHSLVSGTALSNTMAKIISLGQSTLSAVDMKSNGALLLMLISIFWGTIQRRDGIEYGKLLSAQNIESLEEELKVTKETAKKESNENAAEIKELRQQMNTMQTQVEALTAAAQALTQQVGQSTAPKALETPEPKAEPIVKEVSMSKPKPVVVKTPKELGKTEKSSKVKGAQSSVNSAPATTKKKVLKKTKATKKSQPAAANGEAAAAAPKTVKATTKKTIVVSKADWKSLSETTLKRKTVKELTGYLSDKGLEVTDKNGKVLKKGNLVELVLSSNYSSVV